MKENLKTVLFIASIALNAIFAATYVAYKLPSLTGTQEAAFREPLFLQLGLTPDQLTRLKAERTRFLTQLQALGEEAKTKQLELIDHLAATPDDQPAINRKQGEIQRLQGTIQDRVIAHFLQAGSVLGPEQRTRFFRLIKERVESGVQVCSPWSPTDGQRPQGGSGKE